MSDPARKIPEVPVAWDEEREGRVLAALHRRGRRRARVRAGLSVLLAGAVIGALLVSVRALWPTDARTPQTIAAPTSARTVVLADGSVAERLDERTQLRVIEDAPSSSVLELESGSVRFDVKHDPSRPFRVRAGAVLVEVLGTAFTVSRGGGTVTTSVERGHVRVERGGERVDLLAGSTLTLRESAEPRPAPPASASSPVPLRSAGAAPGPRVPPEDWVALARQGEFERAYDAMNKAPRPRRVDPADLLLTADVARLSGHSVEAIAPLERLVAEHADDARAPLAAFTLGRVLLLEVGRPSDAAVMFARAEALAPDGPLAEDALAYEVEAWSRVGGTARARERAEAYVRRFPAGARIRSVRRLGGLD
jgi:transmembrane sensor